MGLDNMSMSFSLQVFCGMLSRIAQFADIMLDAKHQIDKVTYIVQPHRVEHVQGCPVNASTLQYVHVFPKGNAQRAFAAESMPICRVSASHVRKFWLHWVLEIIHVIDICLAAMSQPGLDIDIPLLPVTLWSS